MRKVFFHSLLFLFISLALIPRFHNIYAQEACEIIAPQSVTYGDEVEITVNAPGRSFSIIPLIDYNETELTVSGTSTDFSKTYEAKNGTGKDVQIDLTADLIPKINSNGDPTSEEYVLRATTWNDPGRDNPYSCNFNIVVLPNEESPEFTPRPTLDPTAIDSSGIKVQVNPIPDGGVINGNTDELQITFSGLPNDTYKACLLTEQERCTKGDDFYDGEKMPELQNGVLAFEHVCGNGSEALKLEPEGCDPEKDYFHEGHVYRLGVYNSEFASGSIAIAQFYVGYSYPHVYVLGEDGGRRFDAFDAEGGTGLPDIEVGNPIEVVISQQRKAGEDKQNNFQVVLESTDGNYKSEKCVTVGDEEDGLNEVSAIFTREDLYGAGGVSDQIPSRSYILKINERVNDTTTWRRSDNCQGGFTYYEIPIDIVIKDNGLVTYVVQSGVRRDPNGVETKNHREEFDLPPLPCAKGLDARGNETEDEQKIVECTSLATALGAFPLDPGEFIGKILSYVIYFAGLGGLVLLIYAGYQIMTSRGDKEKIQNAKETIKGVIIGITFIVLSIAILRLIGFDILKIPGFL